MELRTFIPEEYRPRVRGARIAEEEDTSRKGASFLPVETGKERRAVICLGPKGDFVLRAFERRIDDLRDFRILHYEDLGQGWTYTFEAEKLVFHAGGETLLPISVYVRGAIIEPGHKLWNLFYTLNEVLNLWDGFVLCRPRNQAANESKLYQALNSLEAARMRLVADEVRVPNSYFIKGNAEDLHKLTRMEPDLIVKSASGIRSQVVSREVFQDWDPECLKNVPVLFQQRIAGSDVRVHVLEGEPWALQVEQKSDVDYRYAKNCSEMTEIPLAEDVREFCRAVSRIEGNALMGVDFIRHEDAFYCLEANPGPGWAWYHEPERCAKSLIESLIGVLRRGLDRA